MGLMFLFIVLPVLIYILTHKKFGEKTGVLNSIMCVLAFNFYYFFKVNELDSLMIVESCLLIFMGLLSLKLQNPKYFKFQPVVVNMLFLLFLLWFELFDTSYLAQVLPRITQFAPELKDQLNILMPLIPYLTWGLIMLFIVHSIIVTWATLKLSDLAWFWSKLSIYPLLMIQVIIIFYLNLS